MDHSCHSIDVSWWWFYRSQPQYRCIVYTFELGSWTGSRMSSPKRGSMNSSGINEGSDMIASSNYCFSFNILANVYIIYEKVSNWSWVMMLCLISFRAVFSKSGIEKDLQTYDEYEHTSNLWRFVPRIVDSCWSLCTIRWRCPWWILVENLPPSWQWSCILTPDMNKISYILTIQLLNSVVHVVDQLLTYLLRHERFWFTLANDLNIFVIFMQVEREGL